jgi:hypothetical protein
MKRLLIVIATTAAFGAALFAGPTAAPAANCGNYAGSPVKTKGDIACRKAKAIVKEFIKVNKPRLQGFNCKGSDTKVFCKSGAKSISWKK